MRIPAEATVVDGDLVPGGVEVEDGRIVAVGVGSGQGIVCPGFVDLQVNGFAGVDFSDADRSGFERAALALLEVGVTSYQPTLITAPVEDLIEQIGTVPEREGFPGAHAIGIHLEGPFLSPNRAGAHLRTETVEPDLETLDRLLAAGPVSQMTLAPELPGALDVIEELVRRGIRVSCGHTNATTAEAQAAFEAGARSVTHIFNAMRPVAHRDPGIAVAALADPEVYIQAIVDNHHLAPEITQVIWQVAKDRMILVSDAISAAGMADGEYTLGGDVEVTAVDGVARDRSGALAGSALTMIEAVRNLHSLGVPLAKAVSAASEIPARFAGLEQRGRIEPGFVADLVVLDDGLQITRVLAGGGELVAD